MMSALSIFRRFTPARSPRRDWVAASDAEVALAAREQGREGKEAFVEIVRRHQTAVCAVAFSVSGRMAMTDDIAQEAFLRAWKRIATLREPAKLKAWLARIAHDCAVDALRREKPHASLDDVEAVHQLAATDPLPDKMAADADDERLVWSALAKLRENVRTPLVLFYREGQSVAAVAAALDLSEDAVRQRLSRGRNELREQVAAKIEGVLSRVKPSPMLVVAVAGAIGLAAAPEAVAAAAVSGEAAGSSATTVSTTASHYLAAAAALALCLPLGWKVRESVRKATAAAPAAAPAPGDPLAEFADSELLREWRRLHQIHGSDAAAMPVIYDAIQNVPREFHRHALRHALLTEWAGVDPGGGFDFLRAEKQTAHAQVLMQAWLQRDPENAAESLALHAAEAPDVARGLLESLAEKAPQHLATVAGQLSAAKNSGKRDEVAAAFAAFAAKNPAAARTAAEGMNGPLRDDALAGVAAGWAERDGGAALTWSRTLPKGKVRDAALRAAVAGWAKSDAVAALDHLEEVPGGARDEPGVDVMRAAVQQDFDGVINWLSAHSDQIRSSTVWEALSDPLKDRFQKNPEATLQWIGVQSDEFRHGLVMALSSPVAVSSSEQRKAVWTWLNTLPPTYHLDQMRGFLINRVASQDPHMALEWMKSLPDSQLSRFTIKTGLDTVVQRSLLNDGTVPYPAQIERMIEDFPAGLRPALFPAALAGKMDWDVTALELWTERITGMPEADRAGLAGKVAESMSAVAPEASMTWALALPGSKERRAAVASAMKVWADGNCTSASEWINEMPPGTERDAAAGALAQSIARSEPDAAWAWALSIAGKFERYSALTATLAAVQGRDPARARQMALAPGVDDSARNWYESEYGSPPKPKTKNK